MTPNSAPRRGDIVRVRLDPVEGSEQGGKRPGLVISPDLINRYSPVVLVAALTTRKTERVYPFETLVEPPEGGVTERSKILLMQVRCLDKRRILQRYGTLGEATMARVDAAIRISTGLTAL